MKATVISVYMSNIADPVIEHQKRCVHAFLPKDWEFCQVNTSRMHGQTLNDLVNRAKAELVCMLDIDCIPLRKDSFETLASLTNGGALAGGVQRAAHISNDAHLYVGPFLMCFSLDQFKGLGSPSFMHNEWGDVGESLTYVWEKNKLPIRFLWPSSVELPLWPLVGNVKFGIGTTYEELFYHRFQIRNQVEQVLFVKKCKEVLNSAEEGATCHAS